MLLHPSGAFINQGKGAEDEARTMNIKDKEGGEYVKRNQRSPKLQG
jgi:hypothetical protein